MIQNLILKKIVSGKFDKTRDLCVLYTGKMRYNYCDYVLPSQERKVFLEDEIQEFRYDKEDDVLMVWFSKNLLIMPNRRKTLLYIFPKRIKPVLMEILDASEFLKEL